MKSDWEEGPQLMPAWSQLSNPTHNYHRHHQSITDLHWYGKGSHHHHNHHGGVKASTPVRKQPPRGESVSGNLGRILLSFVHLHSCHDHAFDNLCEIGKCSKKYHLVSSSRGSIPAWTSCSTWCRIPSRRPSSRQWWSTIIIIITSSRFLIGIISQIKSSVFLAVWENSRPKKPLKSHWQPRPTDRTVTDKQH